LNLTFQEKSIYSNLLILLTLFGIYLGCAVNMQSPLNLGGAIVLLIVLQIVSQIILRLTSRHLLIDERDRKARAHGSRISYTVLISAIWMSFGYFLLHATVSSRVVVNLLIVALVLAELGGLLAQLISYKTSL
jgi:hypothetical protein